MGDLSKVLAAHEDSGYVTAPAGFGKTYLIAQATSLSAGRQLVLTHTYAGVNALRQKMRALGVSNQLFHIDTIASWSLRLSLSYRSTSGWNIECPADNRQWRVLYHACMHLLDHAFIRKIICASYTGLYVDEYQDCSMEQHRIVLKLARDLPSRILGDPLQGIFDFSGQYPVDWVRDVETNFAHLGVLEVPYRWIQVGADNLGKWLIHVRHNLENDQPIDLGHSLPAEVKYLHALDNPQQLLRIQGNTCRYFQCNRLHTVMAIHKGSPQYKAKCHRLARNLSGRFSSIEEIEGKDLFSFLKKIEHAQTDADCLTTVIEFAKKCMTKITSNLSAGTVRGKHVTIRRNTKSPDITRMGNEYLADPTSAAMTRFLLSLRKTPSVKIIRADLFNRTLGVLRKHELYPELSLTEAAEKYHSEFRHKGRPVHRRRLIGTTLLVKGLEYDHAIVLDATTLSRRELYVALTRGARSLKIISKKPVLNPQD